MSTGFIIALIGAALGTILPGIGSVLGVQECGKAAAGVTSEKPELFGKLLVLQILPGTQGLYGFLTSFLFMIQLGIVAQGGNAAVTQMSTESGWAVLTVFLPIAVNGLISAIFQGKVATAGIMMTAKQPDASGKGITMSVLVETYAILSLIISIMLVFSVAATINA